jgi:hypothetical protein
MQCLFKLRIHLPSKRLKKENLSINFYKSVAVQLTNYFNHLENEFVLNNISKFNSYVTGNMLHPQYRDQLVVNAVYGSSPYLF